MARRLDDLDRRLLTELQAKADRSNQLLAMRLSVSRSTVHRRIVELKAAGVVTGVVAIVSPKHARRDQLVLVTAKLASVEDGDLAPFEHWLAASPDVQTAYLMPEDPAMVFTMRVAGSDELDERLKALLRDNPVVLDISARTALRTIKQTLYLPVDDLGGRI